MQRKGDEKQGEMLTGRELSGYRSHPVIDPGKSVLSSPEDRTIGMTRLLQSEQRNFFEGEEG